MPSLAQFIASRRKGWSRLEALLARSEGNGLRRLDAGELEALASLYRQATSDLAVARRDFPQDQLTVSLNQLAARAHLRVYRAPTGSWSRVWRFFTVGFASRFRASWPEFLLASAVFFGPALWAWWAVQADAPLREVLVPESLRSIMERGRTWTEMESAMRPAMAVVLFTHNIQVSFLAFAGGVFLGLGTVFVLFNNGLSIGAVLGAAQHYGVGHLLWTFVSSHGYLEITSILIAGAAGLMLGRALLRPGLMRRRDALAASARRAVELILGALPVFVVAGLVEAFISPNESIPAEVKWLVGPALGLVLVAFLLLARRPEAGGHQLSAVSRRVV